MAGDIAERAIPIWVDHAAAYPAPNEDEAAGADGVSALPPRRPD